MKTITITNKGIPIYKSNPWWVFWKPRKEKVGKKFPAYLDKKTVYYEKSFDMNGKGIRIGDKVKVVGYDTTQKNLIGQTMKVIGIFEGDLMLRDKPTDPYHYCWPNKVILID